MNVAKEYYRDIRSLLYIWRKYGPEQAYAKFCVRYKSSKAYKPKKNGMPSMPAVISGKLLYLKMVMGEESSSYISLRDKFIRLCPEQKAVLDTNLTYLASYRLDEFEESFGTKVQFAYKPEGRITGRSRTMGFFTLDGEKQFVSINIRCDKAIDSYLASPEAKVLEALRKRLYITLSERGSERFWLITIARMNNEHKKSFKEKFKAKVRINTADQHVELNPEDLPLDSAVDEFAGFVDLNNLDDANPAHPGPYTYDSQSCQYVPIELEDAHNLEEGESDIDSLLSAFVNSGFDFKTLDEWDKIKKN